MADTPKNSQANQDHKPDLHTRVTQALTHIFLKTDLKPTLGIILGSGLGGFASQVENAVAIPYAEIPNFPRSTVEGHEGKLVLGTIGGVAVAVMQGRVHAYEGYSMAEVTFPMRVLGLLGCKATHRHQRRRRHQQVLRAGRARLHLRPHQPHRPERRARPQRSPLRHPPGAGLRFFDMTTAYSPRLRKLAADEAAKQNIPLPEGVYLAVLGPSYETARRDPRLPHSRRRPRRHVHRA